jgi:hypothetical protein
MRYPSVVCAALFCTSVAQAADYPTMAPQYQYMMDHAAEIALAKSAGPPSIAELQPWNSVGLLGCPTAAPSPPGVACGRFEAP